MGRYAHVIAHRLPADVRARLAAVAVRLSAKVEHTVTMSELMRNCIEIGLEKLERSVQDARTEPDGDYRCIYSLPSTERLIEQLRWSGGSIIKWLENFVPQEARLFATLQLADVLEHDESAKNEFERIRSLRETAETWLTEEKQPVRLPIKKKEKTEPPCPNGREAPAVNSVSGFLSRFETILEQDGNDTGPKGA